MLSLCSVEGEDISRQSNGEVVGLFLRLRMLSLLPLREGRWYGRRCRGWSSNLMLLGDDVEGGWMTIQDGRISERAKREVGLGMSRCKMVWLKSFLVSAGGS